MITGRSAFRTGQKGQPLVVLAIFLSIWIGGRAIMWDSPILLAEAIEKSASEILAGQSDGVASKSTAAAIPAENANPKHLYCRGLPDYFAGLLFGIPEEPLQRYDRRSDDHH